MKTIKQSSKRQMKTSIKITIFLIAIFVITILVYLTNKTTPTKTNTSAFSALYSGNSKSDGSEQPAKLNWFDSFKGVNNMGE